MMIVISEYDAKWPALFEEEAHRLRTAFGSVALRIEHVGSTSVPGLAAKPVIDIQVSVASLVPHGRYVETMATLGAAYLKIDMVLVRDVHHKRVSQQIVKAILDMGAGVDAKVIAEGIETQEEAETLKGLGVLWGQGYLFGRPQDPYAPGFRPGLRSTA